MQGDINVTHVDAEFLSSRDEILRAKAVGRRQYTYQCGRRRNSTNVASEEPCFQIAPCCRRIAASIAFHKKRKSGINLGKNVPASFSQEFTHLACLHISMTHQLRVASSSRAKALRTHRAKCNGLDVAAHEL
jgi:hypothetical protein